MKIITLNANGIRSAAAKGFIPWMCAQQADVVCVQETRAQVTQLSEEILSPPGYHGFFCSAQRKGYSGVALYCRKRPDRTLCRLGLPVMDSEGRFIQADFGKLSIVSIYLPSGSSGEARQAVKFDVLDALFPVLKRMRRQRRRYVLCGDWNIAHREIDLKNWRSNRKNSGFLPEERAWMDRVFGELGLVDAFRVLNPAPEQYTWWSNRGNARANNVGWRIDYQIVSPSLRPYLRSETIHVAERFSDHAPLSIEYAIEL